MDSGKLIDELFQAVKRAEQAVTPEIANTLDSEALETSDTVDCEESKR